MPDDASGNFSLVSGYLGITGQVIQPSQHNPPLEDVAAAMTSRLPRSGVAPMTGPLKTITGSASAPAIYPNSNPSVGIYWTPTGIAFAGSVAGVRFIGELIPYTLLTAPALTVFPYGQTLLRASYPDLWAVAQADIAAGNTFYNNGNGATTFGIGDLRGRVPACKDNMGGPTAGRLSSFWSGVDGNTLGASGGEEVHALTQTELPVVTLGGSVTISAQGLAIPGLNKSGYNVSSSTPGTTLFGSNGGGAGVQAEFPAQSYSLNITPFGGGASHNNVQPTIVCNYLLYVGA